MSVKMSERQRPSHPLGGTVVVESEKPKLAIVAADTRYSILPMSLKLISAWMLKRLAYNSHCSLRSLMVADTRLTQSPDSLKLIGGWSGALSDWVRLVKSNWRCRLCKRPILPGMGLKVSGSYTFLQWFLSSTWFVPVYCWANQKWRAHLGLIKRPRLCLCPLQ